MCARMCVYKYIYGYICIHTHPYMHMAQCIQNIHAYGHKQQRGTHVSTTKVNLFWKHL
uniref:Uncharacterized protein n=1 Tax=Nothoprocta perdicaria TaxID=30464 RepID=A0A8C7A1B8_NOTPE